MVVIRAYLHRIVVDGQRRTVHYEVSEIISLKMISDIADIGLRHLAD
jgi:hypothetical protein